MKATDTFRNPAYGHSCAQAIAYHWKELYADPDVVEDYAKHRGGHAPGGLCGALYAAMQAFPEHAEKIKQEFVQAAGDATCREIKSNNKTSCPACVDIADNIVAKYANRKEIANDE